MIDKNYNKNKVYKITFNQTATEVQGNLIVFVGVDKKTVVGKGFDEKITAEDMEGAYNNKDAFKKTISLGTSEITLPLQGLYLNQD